MFDVLKTFGKWPGWTSSCCQMNVYANIHFNQFSCIEDCESLLATGFNVILINFIGSSEFLYNCSYFDWEKSGSKCARIQQDTGQQHNNRIKCIILLLWARINNKRTRFKHLHILKSFTKLISSVQCLGLWAWYTVAVGCYKWICAVHIDISTSDDSLISQVPHWSFQSSVEQECKFASQIKWGDLIFATKGDHW